MLQEAVLFLAAALVCVPLFRRLGLGTVLGYLAAGILIGPSCLALVHEYQHILHLAEFGVILLLFLIGLELQPLKFWRLRREITLAGGGQMLICTLLMAGVFWPLFESNALVIGFCLALSSTAFVLPMLAEKKELNTRHGRSIFAILLFQDLAVIPALAFLPLLAGHGQSLSWQAMLLAAVKGLVALMLVVVASRYLVRPVLKMIAEQRVPELFTGGALFIIIITALIMEKVGLSMSLGAFLAGVLLSESEFRHALQADIEPFKGLLLGLFFISVGMSADLGLLAKQPFFILQVTVGLIVAKLVGIYGLSLMMGMSNGHRVALALAQGGEFAFVLFSVAVDASILSPEQRNLLLVSVTLSMMIAPILYKTARWFEKKSTPVFDEIHTPETPVVIAGFGAFGQIVGRILAMRDTPFTILDKDAEHVDFLRKIGNPVFYSDASRVEVLRAAHVDKAELFVLAIADPDISLGVAETVRKHFPKIRILAVAKTRQHALKLMDLGIENVVRRSLGSSLEMSETVLMLLGDSKERAKRTVQLFRVQDERILLKQHATPLDDEDSAVQTAKESAEELKQLFEEDSRA